MSENKPLLRHYLIREQRFYWVRIIMKSDEKSLAGIIQGEIIFVNQDFR